MLAECWNAIDFLLRTHGLACALSFVVRQVNLVDVAQLLLAAPRLASCVACLTKHVFATERA